MVMRSIKVSCRALTKLQLHAAKYPHCGVNGVLLACKQEFIEDKVLHFVDVVPLFHQAIQLTPMLEVALLNIDLYCEANGLYVAGYYEAPKYLTRDNEMPGTFTCRVADKLKENFGESILVILDNKEIPFNKSLKVYEQSAERKWRSRTADVEFEDGSEDVIQDLMARSVHKDMIDYDDHLDDVSSHWLNRDLNQLIAMK